MPLPQGFGRKGGICFVEGSVTDSLRVCSFTFSSHLPSFRPKRSVRDCVRTLLLLRGAVDDQRNRRAWFKRGSDGGIGAHDAAAGAGRSWCTAIRPTTYPPAMRAARALLNCHAFGIGNLPRHRKRQRDGRSGRSLGRRAADLRR